VPDLSIYNARFSMLYDNFFRSVKKMTNIGDVIRQVETTMFDRQFPPTLEQREVLNNILYKVYTGTVDFGGSR
jgi:hypothetical protein